MDIDDILAEVDGHAVSLEPKDLQELSRAWVTERSAPEILPWPASLMKRVSERIRLQVGLRPRYHSIIAGSLLQRFAKDRIGRGANRQYRPQGEFPSHHSTNGA